MVRLIRCVYCMGATLHSSAGVWNMRVNRGIFRRRRSMSPRPEKSVSVKGKIEKHGMLPFVKALVARKNAPLWNPNYATEVELQPWLCFRSSGWNRVKRRSRWGSVLIELTYVARTFEFVSTFCGACSHLILFSLLFNCWNMTSNVILLYITPFPRFCIRHIGYSIISVEVYTLYTPVAQRPVHNVVATSILQHFS